MKTCTTLVALLLASAQLAGCASTWNTHFGKAHVTASAAEVRSLAVDGRNGAITAIQDASVAGVEVKAAIQAHAATQDEANRRTAEAKLVIEPDAAGTLRVRVDFPEPRHPSDSAAIEIRAARVDGLTLETSNGRLSAEGFTAPLVARTTNGAIRVDRHRGSMTLESSNGSVEARRSIGAVDASTTNGRIEIALDEGATEAIEARTTNGAITLELPASWQGSVDASTSNGRVEIETGGRGAAVRASRNSASATIGDGAKAKATLRTTNGAVRVNAAGRPDPAPIDVR